ncbi:MAG: thioredoxin-like domain-containing protein [Bacteroidetes bacterium]|nr:thioredoxin-like domain-containing protein [Bacteroidota bacterium]
MIRYPMIRSLFIFIYLLAALVGRTYASTTAIEGNADGFRGKVVRLSVYSDLVSGRTEVVATALIGQEGHFKLYARLSDTMAAILSIGSRKSNFILVAGEMYTCTIDGSSDSIGQQATPNAILELKVNFTNLKEDDPNSVLSRFTGLSENFLYTHSAALAANRGKPVYDSLVSLIRKEFTVAEGSFTGIYIYYRMARIEDMVSRWPANRRFSKFLADKPILYNHPGYMDYFNDFFENYLTTKSRDLSFTSLDIPINELGSLSALTDSLGKDKLLVNEQVRELVMIKNLGKLFHDKRFSQSSIIRMLDLVRQNSKFPVHRTIAGNILFQLTHLSKGSNAPVFSLTAVDHTEKTLEDYRGKWVYVGFFTTWCEICLPEMKVIASLKEKYGDYVEFISICCDEDPISLTYYLAGNNNFKWTFFPLTNSQEILDNYEVTAYPLFVLIDPAGKIYQYPAFKPSEHLDELLKSLKF